MTDMTPEPESNVPLLIRRWYYWLPTLLVVLWIAAAPNGSPEATQAPTTTQAVAVVATTQAPTTTLAPTTTSSTTSSTTTSTTVPEPTTTTEFVVPDDLNYMGFSLYALEELGYDPDNWDRDGLINLGMIAEESAILFDDAVYDGTVETCWEAEILATLGAEAFAEPMYQFGWTDDDALEWLAMATGWFSSDGPWYALVQSC